MTRDRIEELIDFYDTKSEEAFRNYQETGMTRYHTVYSKNLELADALRIAYRAHDDHECVLSTRQLISSWAKSARNGIDISAQVKNFADLNGL